MFTCKICNTTYTRVSVLRTHYTSTIHKHNLLNIELLAYQVSNQLSNQVSNQKTNIDINESTESTLVTSLQSNKPNNDSTNNIILELIDDNDHLPKITSDVVTKELVTNEDKLQHDKQDGHDGQDGNLIEEHESLQLNKSFVCFGCDRKYSQKTNLYRHHKTCDLYKEALKLSKKTQTDIEIAARLIKHRNLCRIIPQLKFDDTMLCKSRDTQLQTNISNNNTMNNNTMNNITINNTINVGNWETINFIRPFLHEDISHLYTKENRLKIIASGNNAVNTVINLIYSKPENDNLYRYNSRRNLVKTPDINGQLISYNANEAFAKLAMCILDITDEIMTKSEDILAEYPQYRRGVETYIGTNNWNGEGGNNRYKEYEKNIEMKFETSHKKSETNITMFENEKYRILKNGGTLNFDLESLKRLKAMVEPNNEPMAESTAESNSQTQSPQIL